MPAAFVVCYQTFPQFSRLADLDLYPFPLCSCALITRKIVYLFYAIMLRPQSRPSVRQSGCSQTGQTESLIPLKPLCTRASPTSDVQLNDQSTTKGVSTQREGPEPLNLLSKYWAFSGLILTTLISILLLTGNVRRWTVSKGVYEAVARNRGSTQLVVQVISNALGLLHVTIISVLINYLTRLRLASMATSLDTLRLWNIMLRQSLDLTLPIHLLAILLIFVGICITPSALWAAAVTPISVSAFQQFSQEKSCSPRIRT